MPSKAHTRRASLALTARRIAAETGKVSAVRPSRFEALFMRRNEPVTQHEYALPKGAPLLSVTDEKGRILLANRTFVEVSGFAMDELTGKAHNIVRHPDVPAAVFADMWRTLQSGAPWTGIVKNRRKNGDHYWVQANVTPVLRDRRMLGYFSVRTEPSRTAVAEAERLYRRLNEGRSGLRVERGLVVRAGWLRWLSLNATAPVPLRLAAILGAALLPALLALGTGAAPWVGYGALALGALLSWGLAEQQLLGPLRRISRAARIAAGGQGGLQEEMRRVDELGMTLRAINQMSVNQATIIADVKSRIQTLNAASQEIAQGNMDLSGRTEQQASNLEETAASMEQMSAAVQATAEASLRASELAGQATQSAVRGGESFHAVTRKMEEIAESSRRIADILSVIDGIAFQTNILALNAAVEAARAGEQGRGFAVVASEVRTLAHRSAAAAKQIKDLIDDSVNSVQAGASAVAEAGSKIDDIVRQVRQVDELITGITSSIREQNQGLGQVNQAVSYSDQVTQQNAALVEQTAAAATSLSQQAEALRQAVTSFEFAGA
jgi:aerotaxis receptor